MIDRKTLENLATSFPEVEEHEHFGQPTYRVQKRIFVTLWLDEQRIVLNLSVENQMACTALNSEAFSAVRGAWGDKGWTNVNLAYVKPDELREALFLAWSHVAPKPVVKAYKASLEDSPLE